MEHEPQLLMFHENDVEVEETGLLRRSSELSKNNADIVAVSGFQEGEQKDFVSDEKDAEKKENDSSLESHGVFLDKYRSTGSNGNEQDILEDSINETVTNNGSTVKEEATEYDVETVVRKQNTHNLYCPKCEGCITKTVILVRKEIDSRDESDEQEVFRCLSCFSYFIPSVNGFKLFRCFGDGEEKETPEPSCNWFIPLFWPERKKTESDEDNNENTDERRPSIKVDDHPIRIEDREPVPTEPTENIIGRDTNQWDIVKAIVYGGLVESITSVGVVSSAAGANSTTLNVFAMGIANWVAGLFVIINNLVELRKGQHTSEDTGLSEREGDHYQELLGRRQNFPLHFTVAILSYLFFGALPPIIYGFSFRQTDDKDLKLAAVAGASLLCIAILAFAKAHVRRPPKSYIKTISQFVLTGVSAAGISYLAGRLLDRLIDDLGWFETDPHLCVSCPGIATADSGWAYY